MIQRQEMELKEKPKEKRIVKSPFYKYALLAGAIAGCGYAGVRFEVVRMPDQGQNCPSVGAAIQGFEGQEVGFGPGRRPLYLFRITSMDGTDITMDARMPLAQPTSSDSQVSWLVTFGGVRTNVDGLARTADSACRIVGNVTRARPLADAGTAVAEPSASAGQADAGTDQTDARVEPGVLALEAEAGAGGAGPQPADSILQRMTASARADPGAVQREFTIPSELDSHGAAFPPDSSAEFARRIRETLARTLGSLDSLMGGSGSAPSISIERSDQRGFTIHAGDRTLVLKRRLEVQWDVSSPQSATLRIPYTISSMTVENGNVNVTVAVDCSRDMEAVGTGLGVRNGPHPRCR